MWANAYLGERGFSTVVNAGISGAATGDILAKLPYDLALVSTDTTWAAITLGGVNDRIQVPAVTEASVFANLVSIWSLLQARGMYVYACSEIPVASGHSSASAAFSAWQCRLNKLIKEYWAVRAGAGEYVDMWGVFSDPAVQAGYARANYHQTDNIHPSPLGGQAGGLFISNQIASRRAYVRTRIKSWADSYDNDTTSVNLAGNPLLQGTGGSSSPGTGIGSITATAIPTTWSMELLTGPVGQNATVTTAARSDGYGNDCVVTITGADSTSTMRLRSNSGANLVTRMAVGQRYYVEADISVASGVNMKDVAVFAALTADTLANDINALTSSTESYPQAFGPCLFKSQVCTWQSSSPGTISTALFIVLIRFAGAGGAVVKVGTARIVLVP
jgi:hypothetical protein